MTGLCVHPMWNCMVPRSFSAFGDPMCGIVLLCGSSRLLLLCFACQRRERSLGSRVLDECFCLRAEEDGAVG